jgi:hypothetical protein
MDDNKGWQVAWARFTAFQKAPPSWWDTQTVQDFHDVLAALEEASPGDALTAFRIPQQRMAPQQTSLNSMTGEATYTDERFCDDDFAKRQVEGVAAYFVGRNPMKR